MAAAVDRPRRCWARSCSSRSQAFGPTCRSRCTRPCLPSSSSPRFAAVVYAGRVRFPSREEAVRRLERVSGIPHRPASSYEDTITANADDPRTSAIWQAHRARLAAALARLQGRQAAPAHRPRRPDRAARSPGAGRRSPWRHSSATAPYDRLASAFRFTSTTALASARLDAWVTPPSYTGRPAADARRRRARRHRYDARATR